jgi:hypothetical protein
MNHSEQVVHREQQRRLEEWRNPVVVDARAASGSHGTHGMILSLVRRWRRQRSGWLRLP